MDFTELYTGGNYIEKHKDWHLADAMGKASDIFPYLCAAINVRTNTAFRIAEVGAGVGGVLVESINRLKSVYPHFYFDATGFEISPQAVQRGNELFPELDLRQKVFEKSDGPYDFTLYVDVLEHVENPWEMLRVANTVSQFMVIRQPLLESFSTFRHANYANQREHWGHIAYFNYFSFIDMALATGWQPLKLDLLASWELTCNMHKKPPFVHRVLVQANRILSSYFLSGFYLVGAFKAC